MLRHVRTGSGPPLLLMHGIGLSHACFDGLVGRLAGEREVFAVDLPGFGDSAPLAGPPTMRALADACADFMRAQGHERFHAAGNSLGGGVALHLALDGRALTACGLSPVGFAAGADRALAQVSLQMAFSGGAVSAALMRGPGRVAAVRRALVRQYVEHGDRVPAQTFVTSFETLKAAPGYMPTLRHAINWSAPHAHALPCPITIAWGDHDRLLLTAPQSARARERMPAARHVTLTDCGHLPAWDDPEQVARVVLEASAA